MKNPLSTNRRQRKLKAGDAQRDQRTSQYIKTNRRPTKKSRSLKHRKKYQNQKPIRSRNHHPRSAIPTRNSGLQKNHQFLLLILLEVRQKQPAREHQSLARHQKGPALDAACKYYARARRWKTAACAQHGLARASVKPVDWWRNERIKYDPHGNKQAIVRAISTETC